MSTWKPKHGRSCQPEDTRRLEHLKRLRFLVKGRRDAPIMDLILEIEQGYDLADPLCDAWLYEAEALKVNPFKTLECALQHPEDPTLPPSDALHALVNQLNHVPEWVDFDLINVGVTALSRYPFLVEAVLRNVSLMAGYSVPGVNEPLIQTGNLVGGIVGRLSRTSRFTTDIGQIDGLRKGGIGFRQAISTRLIHGLVRKNLKIKTKADGSMAWDTAFFGVPICQSDLVTTQLQFSATIINGIRLFGARLSRREQQGIIETWNYAGYLMGVDPKRMPQTIEECNRWQYAYNLIQRPNFVTAAPLAKSLDLLPISLNGNKSTLLTHVERHIRTAVTRLFVGDDLVNNLGLQQAPLKYMLLGVAPVVYTLDILRQKLPLVDQLLVKRRERFLVKTWQRYDNAQALPATSGY